MRTNWMPLPDGLTPAARELAERLRALKDASGLSLSEIGTRTHYARSSWERWFNGKRLATASAVKSLADALGTDSAPLLALVDRAASETPDPDQPQGSGSTQQESAQSATGGASASSRETSVPDTAVVGLLETPVSQRGAKSVPQSVPQSVSQSIPQSVPPFAPRALPAAIGDFTGRVEQVERLLALLPQSSAAPGGETVVISSIGGMAGVGKTTLAVHVGHLVQDRFPAGQLYANLRGTTPQPLDPHDVLGGFLRQLGVPSKAVPAEPEERAALYRSVLADRGALVLLDDAFDAKQLRPLIPGGSGSMVLVTARQSVTGVAGAVHLHLDTLDPDSARELFVRIVGAERAAAEPTATDEVLEICAGLPLAVRLAGVRLATRPNWRVRDLADRLHSAARMLDGFDVGDQRLRATFEVSYRALLAAGVGAGAGAEAGAGAGPGVGAGAGPEAVAGAGATLGSGPETGSGPVAGPETGSGPERDAGEGLELPDAARAFCLLGLWTGPALGLTAACALLGLPPERTETLLERLVDANLVESPHPGRYGLHDLLRAYAAERARADLAPSQLESAVVRLVTWYTLAAAAVDRVLAPNRSPQVVEHVPGLPPEPAPATAAEAVAWCQGEQVNLVSAVHLAKASGLWRLARQLPTALWSFFHLQGDRRTWVSTLEAALEAVRLEKDQAAEAAVRNNLAIALIESGRAAEAIAHLETSAMIRRDLGEYARAASTLMHLGIAAVETGEPKRGIGYLQEALEIFRDCGDQAGRAMAHSNLGQLRLRLGDAEGSIAECLEAQGLYLKNPVDDPRSAETKETLSAAYLQLGEVAAARREIEEALRTYRGFYDRRGLAAALRQFGHVLLAAGEPEAAREAWQEAAGILGELSDPAFAELSALLADLP